MGRPISSNPRTPSRRGGGGPLPRGTVEAPVQAFIRQERSLGGSGFADIAPRTRRSETIVPSLTYPVVHKVSSSHTSWFSTPKVPEHIKNPQVMSWTVVADTDNEELTFSGYIHVIIVDKKDIFSGSSVDEAKAKAAWAHPNAAKYPLKKGLMTLPFRPMSDWAYSTCTDRYVVVGVSKGRPKGVFTDDLVVMKLSVKIRYTHDSAQLFNRDSK